MEKTLQSNSPNLSASLAVAYQTAATKAWEAARPRATYGRDVLEGWRNVSGADLKGQARRWGASYQRTRRDAVDHAREYGAHVRKNGRTGELTLEWRPIPSRAERRACSVGVCWEY